MLNELNQETPAFEEIGDVWADIQVASEKMKTVVVNTFYETFTHLVKIRADALEVTNDMEFEYEGIRFQVLYHEPYFSDRALSVIYARSVQE